MVCDRCKMVVGQSMVQLGYADSQVDLGSVTLTQKSPLDIPKIALLLEEKGFELISDPEAILLEQIKTSLVELVHPDSIHQDANISLLLSRKLNRDYSYLSKLFSKREGVSIEKYAIRLKMERVKELVQMNQLNFTQIAYTLGYKSSSHLARQFKSATGLSMSDYKKGHKQRTSLDQIVQI